MRRLPSFHALRAFEAAARLGSLKSASDELRQTPSAISHQVRALEDWFGKPLFVRSVRKIALTDDGQRLLAALSDAFDQIEDVCAVLRPESQQTKLAVHSAPSFAAKWLGPRLRHFMDAHPWITIQLTSSAEPANVATGLIDVDIAYGAPPSTKDIVVEPLGLELTVPMCSPSLFGNSESVEPRRLADFTLIESKLNPVQWSDWWRLNGLKMPNRARLSFDRGMLAIAAAVDGVGIALETTRFAESELAKGELVILDGPEYFRIERQTHFLCFKKNNRSNRQLLLFRNWLYAELQVEPPAADGARGS